ncbi:MAG: flap endonuclease, partial [Microbacterium sp.]|nr:flap endonuclease [Microbacterium sp.]
AAAAAGEGMSAGVRAKILAASDYLDVAPTVVAVATGLDISAPGTPLHPLDDVARDAADSLAAKWNLTSSMNRAIAAIEKVTGSA